MVNTTRPATVKVAILHRYSRKPITQVEVPRPSGRSWVREVYSTAVIKWRREANDWATAVVTELVKAEA